MVTILKDETPELLETLPQIDGLENRIKSRLQSGLVVDLHPTDYELRLGILQSKAEKHISHYPEVFMSDGVLEFLAHRISTNVRVLEGALTRLFAFASLVGREVNLDMVQECLADILRASDRKVTIDEIIRKVSDHYNLRMTDILSPRRARTVARPRQVAMFLAKTLYASTLIITSPFSSTTIDASSRTAVMIFLRMLFDTSMSWIVIMMS